MLFQFFHLNLILFLYFSVFSLSVIWLWLFSNSSSADLLAWDFLNALTGLIFWSFLSKKIKNLVQNQILIINPNLETKNHSYTPLKKLICMGYKNWPKLADILRCRFFFIKSADMTNWLEALSISEFFWFSSFWWCFISQATELPQLQNSR